MIDYYETKAHPITRKMVLEAYRDVKTGGKAVGVDGVSFDDYAIDLKGNLYKLWNRLTSGSYYPSAVREKRIAKKSGGTRSLGIPTVADRVAQQVVKKYLEPKADPTFHKDSYGYRRGKSAHQAIETARLRCGYKFSSWVVDIDVSRFFDTVNHELMLKAVSYYTKEKWVLLYIERWLKAAMLTEDGNCEEREKGTPQGGVISPLLANIYLHFTFDKWMEREFPHVQFERYCDDIVVHCQSSKMAYYLRDRISWRFSACKLQMNLDKTKVVYCKNPWRRETPANVKLGFDFLGYSFHPKVYATKGGVMMLFTPVMSRASKNAVVDEIRKMRISRFTGSIQELAARINIKTRGWIKYYCAFSKWSTEDLWWRLNRRLIKWVSRIKKKPIRKAVRWLRGVYRTSPDLFAHWEIAHP